MVSNSNLNIIKKGVIMFSDNKTELVLKLIGFVADILAILAYIKLWNITLENFSRGTPDTLANHL